MSPNEILCLLMSIVMVTIVLQFICMTVMSEVYSRYRVTKELETCYTQHV